MRIFSRQRIYTDEQPARDFDGSGRSTHSGSAERDDS